MHYYWYGFLFSFNNVHSLVQGTGEYEKLTQGLFENFLDCKFKDPHMDGVSCVKQVSGSNRYQINSLPTVREILHAFLSSDFFSKSTFFEKFFQEQTVWIQIC